MARKTASIFSCRNPIRRKFDISVAAIETNTGELAAPVKEMTVAIDDVKLEDETALQITPVKRSARNRHSGQGDRSRKSLSCRTGSVRSPLRPSSRRFRLK